MPTASALALALAAAPVAAQDMAQEMDAPARPAIITAPLPEGLREEQVDPTADEPLTPDRPIEMGTVAGAPTPAPALTGTEVPSETFYGPPAPRADDGELPQIAWTEPNGFVPPALEEAVNLVTRNYPSANAARAALRAAAADVSAARWLRFPSLQGNLSYLDDSGTPQPQVIVEAPVWTAGRIGAGIRRARAAENATSAQYVETVQDLALLVTRTYFAIASLTQREQLLEGSLAEHLLLVETMERRVEAQISPRADLELARSRAAQIEQQYTFTKASRRTQLRVLAELIADPAFELGPIPAYDPEARLDSAAALEDQAVAYDPTIERLRAQANIARAELEATRASIFPQVNAQYSYDDIFGSRVGVVLRQQTTGGLSQFAQVDGARLRITSALENIRVAEQQLRRDIESTIINFEASKRRAEISQTSASTASRVSASYTRQFIAGRRSWLDVMNALSEAVNAEITKADAEITVMQAASELLLLSGRWRPVFNQDENEFEQVGLD